MSDKETSFQEVKDLIAEFVAERDWEQFHSPKNLSMSIAIEAAELMEHFQWMPGTLSSHVSSDRRDLEDISDELADIMTYCLNLANVLDIDISTAMKNKMKKNCEKYPVIKSKGRSTKYDQL